jgi:hypothetical protein
MYGLENLMINHEKYEIQYQEYDLDCPFSLCTEENGY